MPKRNWEARINVVRGKNLVGRATKTDVNMLLSYIEKLEAGLDEADTMDQFGTEGWRHSILGEDDA